MKINYIVPLELTPEELHRLGYLMRCQQAIERMDKRSNEDIREWAERLAADLAKHTD